MSVQIALRLQIAVVLLAAITAPAAAARVLFDNFNDDSGDLTGQTASTGQVWADQTAQWNTGSLRTHKEHGLSDTVGAGFRATGSKTVWKGNVIPLGATISDGTCVLAVDIQKGKGGRRMLCRPGIRGRSRGGRADLGRGKA